MTLVMVDVSRNCAILYRDEYKDYFDIRHTIFISIFKNRVSFDEHIDRPLRSIERKSRHVAQCHSFSLDKISHLFRSTWIVTATNLNQNKINFKIYM